MGKLENRVAVITGGSGEIGQSIAWALAQEGAHIVINYHSAENEKKIQKFVEEIEQKCGVRSKGYRADVSKNPQVKRMVDDTFRHFNRIDILVNNAGIVRHDLLLSMSLNDWDEVIKTNLYGSYLCSQHVSKYFITQKKGVIINISSRLSERPLKGAVNYVTSKGAIEALTRALSSELAYKGIRINAVAPGIVESKMSEQLRRTFGDTILKAIPMRRFGTCEEVAKVVLFLASDDSSYITGEVIAVSGGY